MKVRLMVPYGNRLVPRKPECRRVPDEQLPGSFKGKTVVELLEPCGYFEAGQWLVTTKDSIEEVLVK